MRICLMYSILVALPILVYCKSRDPYEVLGVSRTASVDDIKAAYKKLVKEWHPDKNKAAESAERFIEICDTYKLLQDPKKRTGYDYFGYRDDSNFKGYEDLFTRFNWDEFDLDESIARNLKAASQWMKETAIPTIRTHFENAKKTLQNPENHKKVKDWVQKTAIPTVKKNFEKARKTLQDPETQENAKKWINEQVASVSSFWQNSILPGLDKLYQQAMEDLKKKKEEFEKRRKKNNN